MERAQSTAIATYLHASYPARSARPPGDLNSVVVNHGRFTGDLSAGFAQLALAVCGLLAFGSMSLAVNPTATLGIAAIGLIVLGAIQPLRRKNREYARDFAALGEAGRLGEGATMPAPVGVFPRYVEPEAAADA